MYYSCEKFDLKQKKKSLKETKKNIYFPLLEMTWISINYIEQFLLCIRTSLKNEAQAYRQNQ